MTGDSTSGKDRRSSLHPQVSRFCPLHCLRRGIYLYNRTPRYIFPPLFAEYVRASFTRQNGMALIQPNDHGDI